MDERGGCDEADGQPLLARSQAEAEGDVGLARSGWPQSDDVLAPLDPATPGKFQHV